MIYIKSYCYSCHELPFIIANLEKAYSFIDKFYLYEYNRTHTGLEKSYNIANLLHLIPEKLRNKLCYKKVDVSNLCEYSYNNEGLIHTINEPIQRSYFFYDVPELKDDDIIIDIDVDEIIYKESYPLLIKEMAQLGRPMSIRLNQFFYKTNYLWKNCSFSSPSIYTFGMVKGRNKKIKGIPIKNCRDLVDKSSRIYGAHMSWIMPVSYMIKKLHCYSHPRYRKFAKYEVLKKAIEDKIYIFDEKRQFNIDELEITDGKIPKYLQREEIFDFIEDNATITNL